jgi:hypothetical protein
MTEYTNWLAKTIGEKLAADSIGKPVFVRLLLVLSADHGLLDRQLQQAAEMAGGWIENRSVRMERMGSARDGGCSALVEYAGGQTALVTVEVVRGEPEARVLIVGQHGTLRFDDYPEVA